MPIILSSLPYIVFSVDNSKTSDPTFEFIRHIKSITVGIPMSYQFFCLVWDFSSHIKELHSPPGLHPQQWKFFTLVRMSIKKVSILFVKTGQILDQELHFLPIEFLIMHSPSCHVHPHGTVLGTTEKRCSMAVTDIKSPQSFFDFLLFVEPIHKKCNITISVIALAPEKERQQKQGNIRRKFLGKLQENTENVKFPQREHSTKKFRKLRQVKWNENSGKKFLEISVYVTRLSSFPVILESAFVIHSSLGVSLNREYPLISKQMLLSQKRCASSNIEQQYFFSSSLLSTLQFSKKALQ